MPKTILLFMVLSPGGQINIVYYAQSEDVVKRLGSLGDGRVAAEANIGYLPAVKAMVMKHSPTNCGSHTWNNGYAGVLLGEYYLRTGDKAALPRLKAICDDSARRQYYGGWSHWGDGTGGGYVCGGLMNPAGIRFSPH